MATATRLLGMEKRLEKHEVRVQLSEEILRLNKKQLADSQHAEDARYNLLLERMHTMESMVSASNTTAVSAERTLDDKTAALRSLVLTSLEEIENTFNQKLQQSLQQMEANNQKRLQLAVATLEKAASHNAQEHMRVVDQLLKTNTAQHAKMDRYAAGS